MIRRSLDVIARSLFIKGRLSADILEGLIFEMVSDVVVGSLLWEGSTSRKPPLDLHFGHYWVAPRTPDIIRKLTEPQIGSWNALLARLSANPDKHDRRKLIEAADATISSQDARCSTAPAQDWESYKAMKGLVVGPAERIPESVLRSILARQHGVGSADVTMVQIRHAGADLCRHYGRVEVVPTEHESEPLSEPPIVSVASASFWKDREDEFRKHDTDENRLMFAEWFSEAGIWRFLNPYNLNYPSTESIQIFKSLAREAAQGLSSNRDPASYEDWLDALASVRDESSDQLVYGKVSTGIITQNGRQLENLLSAGERVPRGAVIEFVRRDQRDTRSALPHKSLRTKSSTPVDMRICQSANTISIGSVFRASASFCLVLRSRSRPETKLPVGAPAEKDPAARSILTPMDRWEQLEIYFTSDRRIQIAIGNFSESMNFDEFGFGNKKNGLPKLAWEILRLLAENDGKLATPPKSMLWRDVEKRMQEIRLHLRSRFGLSEDPFCFLRKNLRRPNELGYRTKFKIGCRPSYNS